MILIQAKADAKTISNAIAKNNPNPTPVAMGIGALLSGDPL